MLKNIFLNPRYQPYWKVLFWLVFATLLFLTLTPQPQQPIKLQNIDKLFHFIAFAGFTALLKIAFQRLKRITIISLSIALGVLIEVIQYFIPNRGFSFADMLADALGALIGLALGIYIINRQKQLPVQ